jgi:RHS repeat-associated protein
MDGTEITYKKNYIAGSKQIAVRTITGSTNTLNWPLTDPLGSTSTTANEDGSWNSTIKYTAFGETRESNGITPTKHRYTGQLLEAEVGLYYYVARFYDPAIMHFVQADTIVPYLTESTSYDRYAYGLNDPIRFSDKNGHVACEDSYYGCAQAFNKSLINGSLSYWKWAIFSEYGITLKKGIDYDVEKKDDNGVVIDTIHYKGKEWDQKNAMIIGLGLGMTSSKNIGNGSTKGSVFQLYEHPEVGGYYGETSSLKIDFYITTTIPYQNFYHEYGHLLDNRNGHRYEADLAISPHYDSNGIYLFGGWFINVINKFATLINPNKVDDPFMGNNSVDAIQHASSDPGEQWADIYANYVIGNISNIDMINWISKFIEP